MLRNIPIVAVRRAGVSIEVLDPKKFLAGLDIIEIPGLDTVSSSEVRRRLTLGENIDEMLDERVKQYIIKHDLYGKL